MIGMFITTLPYRIQLDSHWSFDELVKYVRGKCLSSLEHSHYPLQHILVDSHIKQSHVPFLEIVFDFKMISSNIDQLSLHGADLEQVSLQKSYEVAKFDFMLMFGYNPTLNDGRLSCHFTCSRDLFDEATVVTITRRFQHLFFQLFSSNATITRIDICNAPLSKISLILPDEIKEKESIIFCRQSNIVNEGMSLYLFMNIQCLTLIYELNMACRNTTAFLMMLFINFSIVEIGDWPI
jgi:non-ribosomal peptide synthetase component F